MSVLFKIPVARGGGGVTGHNWHKQPLVFVDRPIAILSELRAKEWLLAVSKAAAPAASLGLS